MARRAIPAVSRHLEDILRDVLRPLHPRNVIAHKIADMVHIIRMLGEQIAGVRAGDEHLALLLRLNLANERQRIGALHGQLGHHAPAPVHNGPVFAKVSDIILRLCKQRPHAAVLPPAGRAEQNPALLQHPDKAEQLVRKRSRAALQQRAVDVARHQTYHIKIPFLDTGRAEAHRCVMHCG